MNGPDDARLTALFQDVPVPDGLAERLLQRLRAEGGKELPAVGGADILACPEMVSGQGRQECLPHQPLWRRRRWLRWGAALLATGAAISAAIWLGSRNTQPLSEQFVLEEAIRIFQAERPTLPLSDKPGATGYPPSRMVISGRHAPCRAVDGFLGRRGVAYWLPAPAGGRAALYVVDSPGNITGLETMPSVQPFTTAGCCASAWQEDGRLYVLVVQGDVATYQSYLDLPREPIAFRAWKTAGDKFT